jgi:hypothetical protein
LDSTKMRLVLGVGRRFVDRISIYYMSKIITTSGFQSAVLNFACITCSAMISAMWISNNMPYYYYKMGEILLNFSDILLISRFETTSGFAAAILNFWSNMNYHSTTMC